MFTRAFCKDAGERAVKTFAQALVPILAADGASLLSIDWPTSLGLAATAAVLSVLTSVASAGIGESGTPSLVSTGAHALDGRPRDGQDHEVPAHRLTGRGDG